MTNEELLQRLYITCDTLELLNIRVSQKIYDTIERLENPELHIEKKIRGKLLLEKEDGSTIFFSNAKCTFLEAIKDAGIHNVMDLGITWRNEPLLTKFPSVKKKRKYHYAGNDLYIYDSMSTAHKKDVLQTISDKLGLNWSVYIDERNS